MEDSSQVPLIPLNYSTGKYCIVKSTSEDKERKIIKEYPKVLAESELTIEALVIFFKFSASFDETRRKYFTITPKQALTFVCSCKVLCSLKNEIFRTIRFISTRTNALINYLGPEAIRDIQPFWLFFQPQNSFTDIGRDPAFNFFLFSKKKFDLFLKKFSNFTRVLDDLSLLSVKVLKLGSVKVETLSLFTNTFSLTLEGCNLYNIDPPSNVKELSISKCGAVLMNDVGLRDVIINAKLQELKFFSFESYFDVLDLLASIPSENRFFEVIEGPEEETEEEGEEEEEEDGQPESLRVFPPGLLGARLRNLRTLVLSRISSDLRITLPSTLVTLEHLQEVVLIRGNLSASEIENLKKIRRLKLWEITIFQDDDDLPFKHFEALTNLEKLSLLEVDEMGLLGAVIKIDQLPILENLKKLRINKSDVVDVSDLFPRLKKLVLQNARKLGRISKLPSLKKLSICSCAVLSEIKELPSLLKLDLCHCKNFGIPDPRELPLLEFLSLKYSTIIVNGFVNLKITGKSNLPGKKFILSGFENLKFLNIRNSPLISEISDMPHLIRIKATYSNLKSVSNLPSLQRACFRNSSFQISKHKYLLNGKIKLDLQGLDDDGSDNVSDTKREPEVFESFKPKSKAKAKRPKTRPRNSSSEED